MKETTIKDVQNRILEIMKYIDWICRNNDINYFIMGGTALGAVRHGGFIPWDDDLDIFMTIEEYEKFKKIFEKLKHEEYVIQEWSTSPKYLEYAKVRMNGTTFIESSFSGRTDIHQGIYVDIMILHKIPQSRFMQRVLYIESKYVTALGLSRRNWIPKTKMQMVLISIIKLLPGNLLSTICYRHIYKYDKLQKNFKWSYWITKAKFHQGIFDYELFSESEDIAFEDTFFKAPKKIKEYLELRYGDYMKLPSAEEQKSVVHAEVYDVYKDYTEYLGN